MSEFGAILAHCSPAEVNTSRSAAIVRVPSDTAAITAISSSTLAKKRRAQTVMPLSGLHSPACRRNTSARRPRNGPPLAIGGLRQKACAGSPGIYIPRPIAGNGRRDGRVAEGARLESVYTGNRIVGSNPTPSAIVAFFASGQRPKIEI